jgi:hypothetical protein
MSTEAITTELYGKVRLSAHGLPSTLLGETGVVGTLIFFWLIVGFFRRLAPRDASRYERQFCALAALAMVVMLLFGLFHQLHQTPAFYTLLAFGYAGATRRAPERRAR